ncbi:MAG: hypothetical protein WBA89_14485 [Microcoleus sp.]
MEEDNTMSGQLPEIKKVRSVEMQVPKIGELAFLAIEPILMTVIRTDAI